MKNIVYTEHLSGESGCRSRCFGIPISRRFTILALLLSSLIASSLSLPAVHDLDMELQPLPKSTDLSLYKSVVDQVRSGHDYYEAVITAQRDKGYPVRPVFTIRLPTLSWLIALISPLWAWVLLMLLAATTAATWATVFIRTIKPSRWGTKLGVLLIILSVLPAVIEPLIWFSETWAGLLLALSLALRNANRWWLSIAVGFTAVVFREISVLYLILMMVMAIYDGRRWEMIGWGSAVVVFGLVFIVHTQSVLALTHPGDLASQGWYGQGGWPLFVSSACQLTTLAVLPYLVSSLLLPLSFFGFAVCANPIALRTLLTLIGYTLLISIFARSNNMYWIWMVSPVLILGLLFVPSAFTDLFMSLVSKSASGRND
jgi:hypothetical protein